MGTLELYVKISGLAAESAQLKRFTRRLGNARRRATARSNKLAADAAHARELSMYFHRIKAVRPEVRAAGLALAFLRGRDYHEVEKIRYAPGPRWDRIEYHVLKFGEKDPRELRQSLEQWHQAADERSPIIKTKPPRVKKTRTRVSKEQWEASKPRPPLS